MGDGLSIKGGGEMMAKFEETIKEKMGLFEIGNITLPSLKSPAIMEGEEFELKIVLYGKIESIRKVKK